MVKIKVGTSSLRNYQRMDYSLHYALGEFIDNSFQAYLDNEKILKKSLKKKGEKLLVRIDYDKTNKKLTVVDNSSGISNDRMEEALAVGSKIDRENEANSLGQFNVGMKASAIWLADVWTIRTKRFDSIKELELNIINEDVFLGKDEILEQEKNSSKADNHFTYLTFENLRHNFTAAEINKAKRYIASMYRRFLNKSLVIQWGNEILEWEEFNLAKRSDGRKAKWTFGPAEMTHDGRKREVRGWLGILESGDQKGPLGAAGANAGITIMRRGRMIQGYPDAWRPKGIFKSGMGNLINQRVIGEIEFDDGDVSFNKSAISSNDLEILDAYLKGFFDDNSEIRTMANRKVQEKVEVDRDEDEFDLEETQRLIENSDLDQISANPIPPDEIIKQRIDKTFRSADKDQVKVFKIDPYKISLLPEYSNDSAPFIAYKSDKEGEIKVVVNMKHPYISNNIVTRNEYFAFLILMIASRYKIETDDRLTMDNYFEVLDQMMKIKITRN